MTQNLSPPTGDAVPAPDHPIAAVDTLKQAMRRARSDDAERAGARAELRSARIGRLELLQDALQPLLTQIPPEVDIFDIALVPASDPRLFIDMIGFVEMGRDARHYLLQQDTRHGRIRVAESETLETMVDAVTDYVARRLLERDKALASDARARPGAKWRAKEISKGDPVSAVRSDTAGTAATMSASSAPGGNVPRRGAPLRWAMIGFAFLIDLLGAIAFFLIILSVCWYGWGRLHVPI